MLNFLERRRGLLDAVVFSGGEPTLQAGLYEAMTHVQQLGFKIGLHTNGAYPIRLKELLPITSWVGMDIKIAFADYDKVTDTPLSGIRVKESAKIILASGVAYEFRTTVHPKYHSEDSMIKLALELQQMGVKNYALQNFRPEGCANEELKTKHAGNLLLSDQLCGRIGAMFENFTVRLA